MKRSISKKHLTVVLLFFILLGCSQDNEPTDEYVTLEAKSNHWIVTIEYEYVKEKNNYIETPYIQYIGEEEITQAVLLINNYESNATYNRVNLPDQLNNHEIIELVTRNEFSSWEVIGDVEITWISKVKGENSETLETKKIEN